MADRAKAAAEGDGRPPDEAQRARFWEALRAAMDGALEYVGRIALYRRLCRAVNRETARERFQLYQELGLGEAPGGDEARLEALFPRIRTPFATPTDPV